MRFATTICLAAFASIALTMAAESAEHTQESLAEIKKNVDEEQSALGSVSASPRKAESGWVYTGNQGDCAMLGNLGQ